MCAWISRIQSRPLFAVRTRAGAWLFAWEDDVWVTVSAGELCCGDRHEGPAGEQREAADGCDGAQFGDPSQGHGVQTAGKNDDAGDHEPSRKCRRSVGQMMGEYRYEAQRHCVHEVVVGGRLPPFHTLDAVVGVGERRLESVSAEGSESDGKESENSGENGKGAYHAAKMATTD